MATETKVEDLKSLTHVVVSERANKQYTVTEFPPLLVTDPDPTGCSHIVAANRFASDILVDSTIVSVQVMARYRHLDRIVKG